MTIDKKPLVSYLYTIYLYWTTLLKAKLDLICTGICLVLFNSISIKNKGTKLEACT